MSELPSPFLPLPFHQTVMKVVDLNAAKSLVAKGSYYLIQKNEISGYFVYLAIVLEEPAAMRLKVELDGNTLIDRTHNDFEAQAAGDLNLDTADNQGNLIHIPDSTSSYYTIVLDASKFPWPFGNSFNVGVVNDNTSAKSIQAALLLYSLSRIQNRK